LSKLIMFYTCASSRCQDTNQVQHFCSLSFMTRWSSLRRPHKMSSQTKYLQLIPPIILHISVKVVRSIPKLVVPARVELADLRSYDAVPCRKTISSFLTNRVLRTHYKYFINSNDCSRDTIIWRTWVLHEV